MGTPLLTQPAHVSLNYAAVGVTAPRMVKGKTPRDNGVSRFGHALAFTDPLAFDRVREGQAVTYTPVVDSEGKAGGARAMDIVLLPAGYAVAKL